MNNWKSKKFGNSAELIKETYTPVKNESLSYVGLEHIQQNTLQLIGIGDSSQTTSNKFKFKQGDILFGKLRPYFRKVICPNFDGVCSTDIFVIRSKSGVEQHFLFYWMVSQEFINFASSGSTGTKMPRADWEFLCELERRLPTPKEQKRISNILWALDETIKNCKNQINILEKIIQTIFKSKFVDFNGQTEFVDSELGKIPKKWNAGTLEDVSDIYSGGTPSTKDENYWDGGVNWLSSGETRNNFIIDTERKISLEGVKNSSTSEAHKYDVVIASAGQGNTRGQTSLLFIDTYVNQSIIVLHSKKNNLYSLFLFCNIKSRYEELRGLSDSNSSRGSLPKNIVVTVPVIIPTDEILLEFNDETKSILDKIEVNEKQIQHLLSIRESLLPKLMTGEIKI